jgi:hypothetical protein
MINRYNLVTVIIFQHKTIVEQKARVTLFSIRVKKLLAQTDILKRLNKETFFFMGVIPYCFLRYFMVEHICEWYKNFSLLSINYNSKNPTTNHHSGPTKISKCIFLVKVFTGVTNRIIIFFQVHHLLLYLIQKGGSDQFSQLFSRVIDWET